MNPEELHLLHIEGEYGIWYLKDEDKEPTDDNARFAVWALENSLNDMKFRDLMTIAAEQAAEHRS